MTHPPTLSQQRTRWFKAIAILLPLVALFLLEGVLRLVGYGQEYPLFVVSDEPGHVVMNPRVSEKYFTNSRDATIGFQEPFSLEKGPNTFRIFVLGASTAVGYPYLHNGSFHRWLQYRLNRTFPDKPIEVINLALTAVNSYTVGDFAHQLPDYQPDAVLIYAGHNEYYGALGVGSTSAIGSTPILVRLVLYLREYRIVQWLTSVIHTFRPSPSESDLSENLMKRMAAQQAIPYQSDLYHQGIRQYETNMTDALSFLNKNNIPTFISTLVSNEKDLRPFISDTTQAEVSAAHYYQVGQQQYAQGNFAAAKQAFVQAKEWDMLRFRAPEAMNKVIVELAKRFPQVHLVDAKAHFESMSPHRIVGQEMLLEHVHPNLRGYAQLADAFYQQLQEKKMIEADWSKAMDARTLQQEMPITAVDSLAGAYEVMILKEGWPFYQPITEADTAQRTLPEAIAGALAVRQISWEEAMERLYQYYYQNQQYEPALKVAEAVTLEHPDQPQFFTKAAGLALQLNNFAKADYLFQRALSLNPSATLARKIAVNFIQADAFATALPYLEYTAEHAPNDRLIPRLIEAIKAVETDTLSHDPSAMTQLAEHYAVLGKQEQATIYLQDVLANDPANSRARALLEKLNR